MPVGTQPNLVPQPASVQAQRGSFTLPPDLAIDTSPEWAAIARRLLSPGTGLDLPVVRDGAFKIICDQALAAESYRLTVSETGIEIVAADDRGVNWAVQTLRQLLPPSALRPAPSETAFSVAAVTIADHPRFAWRGVMLDTARHFMPVPDLFGFVDLLALHKYNVFHLHLSEDQGWRFESKKYPRLTEISSHRIETCWPKPDSADGTPHGGFYTQDQLRSLVSYASQRGITIVPEIEFPGHVLSVLAAFPQFGNNPDASYQTATTFRIFTEVLNLSDAAVAFVFDLYEELLDVFPSTYIHVGGDECPRTEWLDSPAAKELAEQRGLADPSHLQRWFTEQLRDWLAERGRQLVGWDEICDEGPLEGAVSMAWRNAEYGIAAAKAGLDVVMSPCQHTYFDYYPSADEREPYSIGGLITTEQAYSLDPFEGIPEASQPRILGTQCQIWTEYMPQMARVQYMLFPRACAHSEVAWSDPTHRSWEEFKPRLAAHLERLGALGVNYRPEDGPRPWQQGGIGVWQRFDRG